MTKRFTCWCNFNLFWFKTPIYVFFVTTGTRDLSSYASELSWQCRASCSSRSSRCSGSRSSYDSVFSGAIFIFILIRFGNFRVCKLYLDTFNLKDVSQFVKKVGLQWVQVRSDFRGAPYRPSPCQQDTSPYGCQQRHTLRWVLGFERISTLHRTNHGILSFILQKQNTVSIFFNWFNIFTMQLFIFLWSSSFWISVQTKQVGAAYHVVLLRAAFTLGQAKYYKADIWKRRAT